METIKFVTDYKHQDGLRRSFNRLARDTFGIDFEAWYSKGYWDERYVCSSFLNGEDEVVANVSASRMELIVKGIPVKAVQLGTVMTRPDYRGRGLSRMLLEHVLEEYAKEAEFIYLFANRSVLDFYPKYGFLPVQQTAYTYTPSVEDIFRAKPLELRKLDPGNADDESLIHRAAVLRRPVSHTFGAVDCAGILMFYVLNVYGDYLYSCGDRNVVIMEREGNRLHLYDWFGPDDADFYGLVPLLVREGIESVRFHFTPELLGVKTVAEPNGDPDDICFVRPPGRLEGLSFCAPKTAQT